VKCINQKRMYRIHSMFALVFFTPLFLLYLLACPCNAAKAPQPESKLGRWVQFPGIEEATRVAPLKSTALELPDEVLTDIVKARDRNAFWLICEDRRDYRSISYIFEYKNNQLVHRIMPVRGRYDRGVYLQVPSEYLLYHGDCSAYEYEYSTDYFKVTLVPGPKLDQSELYYHGIPDFIIWASKGLMALPFSWRSDTDIAFLDKIRENEGHRYGFEVWFARDDLRLIKELITVPSELTTTEGEEYLDYANPKVLKEIRYTYLPGTTFPEEVLIIEEEKVQVKLRFQMIDGFWMLSEGKLSPRSDNNQPHSLWIHDISIER